MDWVKRPNLDNWITDFLGLADEGSPTQWGYTSNSTFYVDIDVLLQQTPTLSPPFFLYDWKFHWTSQLRIRLNSSSLCMKWIFTQDWCPICAQNITISIYCFSLVISSFIDIIFTVMFLHYEIRGIQICLTLLTP